MVTPNTLHGSQRAESPLWALASDDDAHAAQWIRMAYVCRRQPQPDEPSHPFPGDMACLTASRKCTLPKPAHRVAERNQRSAIHGHSEVSNMPTDCRTQPPPYHRYRVVPAMVQFQFELAESFSQYYQERFSLRFVLQSNDEVIHIAHDDDVVPHILGGSDHTGFPRISRYRCSECGLPHLLTASAFRRLPLSQLSSQPARTPVNASSLPSRATTHDSGPLWATIPLTYDSFIHFTSPVYPGIQGARP